MKAFNTSMKVSQIYADVLFELAQEHNMTDAVKDDLDSIGSIFVHEPDFETLICAPNFSEEYKADFIRKLFESKINQLTMNFLMTAIKHHRIMYLHGMIERYNDFWLAHNGYSIVEMTIAKELDSVKLEYYNRLLAEAISRKIKLTVKVNPYIMGGAIIRYGDKVIDNSIRERLNTAVNTILNNRMH